MFEFNYEISDKKCTLIFGASGRKVWWEACLEIVSNPGTAVAIIHGKVGQVWGPLQVAERRAPVLQRGNTAMRPLTVAKVHQN